jgi:molecular chaperone DnaK (HSP70)
LARAKAGETPGRVVHSAKSWLCHHAADRSAPFLPWGTSDLTREQKISPVRASALILNYVRWAWDSRFAAAGFAFDDQEITVAVPASFDAGAQQLTMTAADRTIAMPSCGTHWSSISAAAPLISVYSNCVETSKAPSPISGARP